MSRFTLFKKTGPVLVLFFSIFLISAQIQAQSFPTCSKLPKCVSQDLEVVGAFLTSSACTCSSGGTVTATLNLKLLNKTGSTRTSFAFFANLVEDPLTGSNITKYITACNGPVPPNSTTTLPFGTITYTCGSSLTLTDVYLAWTDASANSTCATLQFCNISPKCGKPPVDIKITTLLSATATTSAACEGGSDGSITVAATGGTPPYTYSINNGNFQSSPTFSNLGVGTYTLKVKDNAATPCEFTFTKELDDKVCCVTPTIDTDPADQTKCAPASASFSVTASGGNPAPTYQWQVSAGGGAFTNISNGSPYSGATTANLTVNPTSASLDGNKYRCVVTSGTCPSATSDDALLTVSGAPGTPSATYNAPACDADKFSVTISSVISGAVYTIKDKDGNDISGVLPGTTHTPGNNDNFSFTNIPAGSGFKVSVSNNGCPAAASNNCGTATTIASSSTLDQVIESSVTKVKVAPNPYNDRIRFTIQASESGRGSLELYNIMGQKMKTVYEGFIEKGQTKNIEYTVPFSQRAMLVYVFRIGSQKTAGKLISVR